MAIALCGNATAQISSAIEGVVCETGTCAPINGARVSLTLLTIDGTKSIGAAVTDRTGTFRFQQLEPGVYSVNATADNHRSRSSEMIRLSEGQVSQNLKLELQATVTISGRVFDENDEPLANATVEALALRELFIGKKMLTPIMPPARTSTNDRGEFRIPDLDSNLFGNIYIRILPAPAPRADGKSYPIFYYPRTTDPANAAEIVLPEGGGEVTNIDTSLAPLGVRVRGRLIRPTTESMELRGMLISRNGARLIDLSMAMNTRELGGDRFELSAVMPGAYDLYIITGIDPKTGFQWVRTSIYVGTEDLDDVRVTLTPTGTIHGRIVIEPGVVASAPLDVSSIYLQAFYAEHTPASWSGPRASIGKDGTFSFEHLSEATLFFGDPSLTDGWYISAIRLDGEDVTGKGFSSTPGKESNLEVRLNHPGGTVNGVIKDGLDKPIPGGRFVLLPAAPLRGNPIFVKTGAAYDRGAFTIENVAPGDYTLIGFPDDDTFNPVFLRTLELVEKYESYGKRIHVNGGQATEVTVVAAPPG